MPLNHLGTALTTDVVGHLSLLEIAGGAALIGVGIYAVRKVLHGLFG